MRKKRDQVAVGDAVEVRFMRVERGREPYEEWVPATVSYAHKQSIGVVFSDSERTALPLYAKDWRRP